MAWIRLSPLLAVAGIAVPFSACARAPQTPSHVHAIFDRSGQRLPDSAASSDQVDWQELTPQVADYQRWNGVGTIAPGCTATLLKRPGDAPGAAYLLTAGHCVLGENGDPNSILVGTESAAGASLGRYLDGSGAPEAVRVETDRVMYATLKGTDAAILRVRGDSYGDLLARGLHPLALSAEPTKLDQAIVMPHEPQEGVYRVGLRLSSCRVGASADIREGSFQSFGVFRNHCSAVGGTSGAAVVDAASNQIVGILTTGTRDATEGLPDCIDSRPCEVQPDGSTRTFSDENYAQHVQQMAGCFAASGDFDLTAPGCGLEKPPTDH